MRTADRSLALLYFEREARVGRARDLAPSARYRWRWFDPRTGVWSPPVSLRAEADRDVRAPAFPDGGRSSARDWAAELTRLR
jgi:hypothetical protein